MRYYDKDGKLIGLMKWASLFEQPGYRFIGQTHVENITISTIWVGFDLSGLGDPPLIFESMVFEVPQGDDVWRSLECRRYRTLHEAQVGHTELCLLINTMMDIDKDVSDAGVRDVPDLQPDQEDPADLTNDGEGTA